MDPDAALKRILESLEDGDCYAVHEYWEALRGWVNGGGFLPEGWDRPRLDILLTCIKAYLMETPVKEDL